MSDEILKGATLYRAIADAIEAGETPDVFSVRDCHDRGVSVVRYADITDFAARGYTIRRKPRTRHLIDQNGKRWEWPEPLQDQPEYMSDYYIPVLNHACPATRHFLWQGIGENLIHLRHGLCHATGDGAVKHARALIAASGGRVSDE